MLTPEMQVRAKPILFNTEMVEAILEGRKTQTRRLVSGRLHWKVGDVLWVRETWCFMPCIECTAEEAGLCAVTPTLHEDRYSISSGCYLYRAGSTDTARKQHYWNPSIHMPRTAARIFLEIIDVRRERLQDITPADLWKEGIPKELLDTPPGVLDAPLAAFRNLWDSTLTKKQLSTCGWDANPTVDVYTFRVIQK